ncbi:MBL fold metallo-hydrolase [Sphingomonas sp. LT1P40]|uniref:MBL fold metallo-hydrolase n=1 Tax=Alteristakelama amylovorans TaxID=3096166 RepID=UPI002FCA6E66
MIKRWLTIGLALLALSAVTAAMFAPFVYAELVPYRFGYFPLGKAPVKLAAGRMVDDYFAVQDLGGGTYAIGEPRYYQANYSYLIVGSERALLFDAGSGSRNMRPLVERLARVPVTVLPSHLHFDHLGGIAAFDRIAMLDNDAVRAQVHDGVLKPDRYAFLGMFDGKAPPAVKIAEWIKPETRIDLGDRVVTILSTPGHTPHSAAILDERAGWLFTGDFIYPTMLYAFLPGASMSDYRRTAQHLIKRLPERTVLWTAHCCRRGEGFSAPRLAMHDLRALDRALARREAGEVAYDGFFPRRYPVNDQMVLGTGFSWNNR